MGESAGTAATVKAAMLGIEEEVMEEGTWP